MKTSLILLSLIFGLSGCAFRAGHGGVEATLDVPDVVVEVPLEYRNRPHLTHHGVHNGTRYCHYSDGRVTQRHPRYDCPWY